MYCISCEGKLWTMPEGSSVGQLWEKAGKGRSRTEAVLAFYEGAVVDLQTQFSRNGTVQWIPMNHPYAEMAAQRTLIMLLIMTVKEIYGETADVEVEHSLGKALYCEFRIDHPILQKDLKQIEKFMHFTVKEGRPIYRRILSKERALHLLRRKNQKDALLLEKLPIEKLTVYQCGNFMDSYLGPMLPDMNYLGCFKLEPYAPGFLLRFPAHGRPHELPPYHEEPLFARVFLEAEKWGQLIGCRNVAELNHAIHHNKAKNLILISESLHEKKIAHIADIVQERDPAVRMICISGPSSAGKTPFMKRLIVQLRVNGIRPVTISLDDYYRERGEIQAGETINFEDLSALDVNLFQETMSDLLEGKSVKLPVFEFSTGTRHWKEEPISLEPDQPVIIEGLHAFHPELTRFVPGYQCIHVYLGALTQLALNRHNRISTTDTRLLRRLVRDSIFRANTAEMTLSQWDRVRDGEERNIFHFQNRADVVFNTALIYELPVLKMRALPLLESIREESPAFSEAWRLRQFLEPFEELDDENVPANSILREFIGP